MQKSKIKSLLFPIYNAIYDKNKKYIGFDEEDMENYNINIDEIVEILEEFEDADGYTCVSINIDVEGVQYDN